MGRGRRLQGQAHAGGEVCSSARDGSTLVRPPLEPELPEGDAEREQVHREAATLRHAPVRRSAGHGEGGAEVWGEELRGHARGRLGVSQLVALEKSPERPKTACNS